MSWGVPAVLVIGLVIFHAPILRGAARLLIAEESEQPTTVVLILDGDRVHDRAARLYHAGQTTKILIIERRPNRLQRAGILPAHEAVTRRELLARGVPEEAIAVIPGTARTDWDRARALKSWVEQHPQVEVTVLCDRFYSARHRLVFERVTGDEIALRLRWQPLPDRDYDESNWWRHKAGVLDFVNALAGLTHVWLSGETDEWCEWNPDDYEKNLD